MYWNTAILGSVSEYFGLTLTWDVLKFNKAGYNSIPKKRLTLTWDVLKFQWK